MNELKWLLVVHLAATLLMTGVIWVIQLVHYPLFRFVGDTSYAAYQAAHMNAITLLVLPLMLVEAGTGLLLAMSPPAGVPGWQVYLGFALIGVVWFMTVFINSPQHIQLSAGFNEGVHQALVSSNWIRTAAWTVRAGLVVWMLMQVMTFQSE